jgi:hypothetical protein
MKYVCSISVIILAALTVGSSIAKGGSTPAKYAIKAGSLLDHTTPVDMVLINGKIIYQRTGINLVVKGKTYNRGFLHGINE